ncbi:MAG: hypothetical protein IJU58_01060 [Clostridia bacterium]|nr:hypothetical protein [Clostridia bacterium]
MSKLNEALGNLEDLGIFQLRELAREVGVHLPTTMRKAELIQKIREVASGEAEPFVPTTKKGRPPKQYQVTSSQPNAINREYDYRNWGKSILPYAEKQVSVYRISDNSSFIFDERKYGTKFDIEGIVSIDEAGNARLHEGTISQIGEKRIARIEYPVITKFGIKDGDYIKGRMGESLRDGGYSLFDVRNINGQDYPLRRIDFASSKALPVVQKINFENPQMSILRYVAPVGKGQRVLVRSCDNIVPKHFLHTLAKSFSDEIKVLYLSLDEQPEDYYDNNQANLEYVLCPFDLPVDKQLYILELALNRVKRMAEIGQDVVIVLEDLFTIARLYGRCYKASGLGDGEEYVIDCIKRILACGRNMQDAGTITLVVGVSNNQDMLIPDGLMYEIKKACNCFVTFNSSIYLGQYDFDIANTYTLNPDRLLNEKELALSLKIRQETKDKSCSEINLILAQNK